MRLPNLSVSDNVTNTIRSLDLQRYELDRQISSGQKLSKPEDDGMRVGRLIRVDAQKNQLAQFQRNASYASEFLNAGHLNLDNLRELNLRAQEISRVAGSNLNESAGETYGHEINQLIEEALNRVNASHRGRSLFGGTEYKPNFGSSKVRLGTEQKKVISLNSEMVGDASGDGTRKISSGEEVVFQVNGREYVVHAKADGVSTSKIVELARDLINQDTVLLSDSPEFVTNDYRAHVRTAVAPHDARNENAKLYADISVNGELEIYGTVGQAYSASADFITSWDPSLYFPEQTSQKLNDKAKSLFSGLNFDDLTPAEKQQVRDEVFSTGIPVYNLTGDQVNTLTGSTDGVEGNYSLTDKGSSIHLEPMELTGGSWRKTSDVLDAQELISADYPNFSEVESYLLTNDILPVGETPIANWERQLVVSNESSEGTTNLEMKHAENWRRLQSYEYGSVIQHDGKLWQSIIDDNRNHKPSDGTSLYWKEIPSGYDVEREDWNLRAESSVDRFYFMAPDGRFFDVEQDAISYTAGILVSAMNKNYDSVEALEEDIQRMVKEVTFPVTQFDVDASESKGAVTFDTKTHDYILSAATQGADIIDGLFLKGNINRLTDVPINADSVVLHEGRYYLTSVDDSSEDFDSSVWPDLTEESRTGGGAFLLGDALPIEGKEIAYESGVSFSAQVGDYVYDRASDQFFVATENVKDASSLDTRFKVVDARSAIQGAEWASNFKFDTGQIVLHDGKYYQCQRDGFENFLSTSDFLGTEVVIKPNDEFILNEENQRVANDIWKPLDGELAHVLSFAAERKDAPSVTIMSAGATGQDATAQAVVDTYGNVVGLKVVDAGRYFFGSSSSGFVPPDFEKAKVLLDNGQEVEATILWEENPSDPGPYRIAGFELPQETVVNGAPKGPRMGDTFSFATGTKTFLDHRDSDGNIIDVSYLGGEKNSKTFVGKDTSVSYMLDSSDGQTEKLGDVVKTLVQLRDGLAESNPVNFSDEVNAAENNLIGLEDDLINKMGELSAVMVRMDTVKLHDEDYFMQLDEQISRDLNIDMSEAIMRLTRVSTAYQAAMQVGAQMLNNSLLNYL